MYASRRLLVGFLGVIVFIASCGMVQVRYPDGTTEYQSVDEFAAYVEEVFRYHNRVVNDLIVATSLMGKRSSTKRPRWCKQKKKWPQFVSHSTRRYRLS